MTWFLREALRRKILLSYGFLVKIAYFLRYYCLLKKKDCDYPTYPYGDPTYPYGDPSYPYGDPTYPYGDPLKRGKIGPTLKKEQIGLTLKKGKVGNPVPI